MNHSQQTPNYDRPAGSVVSELIHGLQKLVKSEIKLARVEIQSTASVARRHVLLAAVFGVVALCGILPFLSFLVIGLGVLLNENYWLSSLIVSLVFFTVGAILVIRNVKKITQQDFSLPNTRSSVQDEMKIVRNKIHDFSESIQRRAS